MYRTTREKVGLGLIAALIATPLAGGCDTAPYDNTVYSAGNTERVISFSGYGTHAMGPIRLQAKNQSTNQWETFATTSTSAAVGVAAGYWVGSPALYPWSVDAQLVSVAAELDHWRPNTVAQVRIQEYDFSGSWKYLYVYEGLDEIECMVNEAGEAYDDSYLDCADGGGVILHLIDVD